MYDIIFEFLRDNVFNSTYLVNYQTTIFGVSTNLNIWLSHTITVALMVLFVVCLVFFAKWLFRICSGLFLLR